MVRPVEDDARGILAPEAGLAHFCLDRRAPSPHVARFVQHYWIVAWDLRGRPPYRQRVPSHPVVNLVVTDGEARVHGVPTAVGERLLADRGSAVGVKFRPAGFRPLLDGPMTALTDRAPVVADLLPGGGELTAAAVAAPKAVVRRYRLFEAAEAARRGPQVDWAALAADLGYSDQAHLTRDFTAVVGMPPSRYARTAAAS